MLAFIQGQVSEISEDFIVLEVSDIGYKVHMGLRDLATLEIGQRVKVQTEMVVREDDVSLYGFLSILDRSLFNQLRAVSGIGTRTANNILGMLDGREIIQLIIDENHTFLTRVPGIGKKTAARIIVELRDRFLKQYGADFAPGVTATTSPNDPKFSEFRSALSNMGYNRREIDEILQQIDPQISLEEMLKHAFRLMAR
ncbi:MAG: Holliday junction branch migration protein RuvA [Tissierellia bacterium]|jgi:Holliday junction DNA helicase RuvA|nr:Holliday junction branch migration protein RuvA [Tissierellia bacterium]